MDFMHVSTATPHPPPLHPSSFSPCWGLPLLRVDFVGISDLCAFAWKICGNICQLQLPHTPPPTTPLPAAHAWQVVASSVGHFVVFASHFLCLVLPDRRDEGSNLHALHFHCCRDQSRGYFPLPSPSVAPLPLATLSTLPPPPPLPTLPLFLPLLVTPASALLHFHWYSGSSAQRRLLQHLYLFPLFTLLHLSLPHSILIFTLPPLPHLHHPSLFILFAKKCSLRAFYALQKTRWRLLKNCCLRVSQILNAVCQRVQRSRDHHTHTYVYVHMCMCVCTHTYTHTLSHTCSLACILAVEITGLGFLPSNLASAWLPDCLPATPPLQCACGTVADVGLEFNADWTKPTNS